MKKFRLIGHIDDPNAEVVALTLPAMREYVLEAAADADFQRFAQELFADCPTRACIIAKAVKFAKENIIYAREPGEILVKPTQMLKDIRAGVAVGDCDDLTMFVCALVATQHIQCGFTVFLIDGVYQHVAPTVWDGRWVVLDPTANGRYRFTGETLFYPV